MVSISNFDASEYIENEEDAIAYLNAAAETGDPALLQAAIGDIAKARGMGQIAKEAGVYAKPRKMTARTTSEVHRLHELGIPKADIARDSLKNRGALILVQDREEGMALINRIAPEHLELSVDDPDALLDDIRHAGAIFMGRHTPEAIGDYCAGPNHVLPTSGTARFSSPLGVYDFQKKSSIIYCSESGSKPLAETADILAQREDLEAHARSARYRYQ